MKDFFKKTAAVFLALTLIPISILFIKPKAVDDFALYCVNNGKTLQLDEKQYLIGALAATMPIEYHSEALKAQVCVLYTNAIRARNLGKDYVIKINTQNHTGYIDKDTLKKVWGNNFDTYYNKLCAAVDGAYKSVITHNGKPIVAAYHSLSCGRTQSAETVFGKKVEYLVSVDSEGDTFCPTLSSEKTVSADEARKILSEAFPDTFLPKVDSLLFTDVKKAESDGVISFIVGDREVSGGKIRELFNLPSACFDIKVSDGKVIFSCKGRGHGVGMSLYGADFLARQGKSYDEILKHYYRNTQIMYAK